MLLQAGYAIEMEKFSVEHPKPPRRPKARDPSELKRPQGAFFFFLEDFREKYRVRTGQVITIELCPTVGLVGCAKKPVPKYLFPANIHPL